MTENSSQYPDILRSRQENIVNRWYEAIAPVATELDAVEAKSHLAEFTQQAINLLLAETLEREQAQAIGEALAYDVSAKAQVLGRTQEVLAQHLVEGLSVEQISTLQPRLIGLLGELAIGFVAGKERLFKSLRAQYLSFTIHEMKSPLNAIIGFSRIILKGVDGPITDTQEQDLTAIYEGGRRLHDCINTVFDIKKTEVGKIDFESGTFDLAELVDTVVTTVQPMIEENDNTLKVHADNLGQMHSDPERIQQVLINLLGHAAKFTRQGTITLTITREPVDATDWVRFQIADTGLGMTQEQIQRFIEAGDLSTQQYGDIGLTISQRFCRMLGGEIAVESEVDKGSTFTVSLPAHTV